MYIRANLKYKRQLDLEKAEAHVIFILITKKGFGLTFDTLDIQTNSQVNMQRSSGRTDVSSKIIAASQLNVIITRVTSISTTIKRQTQAITKEHSVHGQPHGSEVFWGKNKIPHLQYFMTGILPYMLRLKPEG